MQMWHLNFQRDIENEQLWVVYLVWIGGVERREKVITSKGNLTKEEEEKKKKTD